MQVFKKLAAILLSILGILVIGIVILLFVVDPNRYKSRIEAFAENRANISLLIDGNLSWTFYPWLGISIEDTRISALNDTENPIAAVHELSLSLKLIPLLKGDIEIDQLQVDGLNLEIITNADGTKNIGSFLTNRTDKIAPIKADSDAPDLNHQANNTSPNRRELNIRTINFTNSQFQIKNQLTQREFTGNNIDFMIQNIHRNAANFSMDTIIFNSGNLQFKDLGQQKQLCYQDIHFDLKAFTIEQIIENFERNISLKLGEFNLKGGEIRYHYTVNGQTFLVKPHAIQARNLFYSNFVKDQAMPWNIDEIMVKDLTYHQQSDAHNSPLQLDSINFRLTELNPLSQGSLIFDITGEQKDTLNFKVAGHSMIQANQSLLNWRFEDNDITTSIDQLPNLTLEKTLQIQLKSNIDFDLEKDTFAINPLTLHIDQSTITGDILFSSIQKQQGIINLQGDFLDLNDYLPAKTANTQNASKETRTKADSTSQAATTLIPKERAVTINAALKKLNFGTITAQNIQLNAQLQPQRITISEAKTTILGGNITAKGTINTKSSDPIIAGNITISALPLTNLFKLLQKQIPITGNLNLTGQLQTQGLDQTKMMNQLQGDFQANITNGQLIGIDYEQLVCEGFALLNRETFRKNSAPQTTAFKKLSGNATIRNGIITNNHLQMEIPGLAATGSGNINLNNETLNYRIGVLLKESTGMPNCKIDQYLKNVTIPLHCQGSYINANSSLCTLNQDALGNLIADFAKNRIESTIKENLQEILPPALQQNMPKNRQDPKPKDVIKAFEGLFKR